jgi:hypothetical protein
VTFIRLWRKSPEKRIEVMNLVGKGYQGNFTCFEFFIYSILGMSILTKTIEPLPR